MVRKVRQNLHTAEQIVNKRHPDLSELMNKLNNTGNVNERLSYFQFQGCLKNKFDSYEILIVHQLTEFSLIHFRRILDITQQCLSVLNPQFFLIFMYMG